MFGAIGTMDGGVINIPANWQRVPATSGCVCVRVCSEYLGVFVDLEQVCVSQCECVPGTGV